MSEYYCRRAWSGFGGCNVFDTRGRRAANSHSLAIDTKLRMPLIRLAFKACFLIECAKKLQEGTPD